MAEASGKAVQVKLVLLGEAAVGKSSLVCRFVQNDFNENTSPTIGAAFSTQKCRLDNRTVKFEIWDTAGQERFHSLAPMYYRNAQAAVVVYDITKATSLEKAKSWVKELQRQASPNIVIALVGNKLDLVADADASGGSAKSKTPAPAAESSAESGETEAAAGEDAEEDTLSESGVAKATSAATAEEDTDADVDADTENPRQISTAEASTYAAEAKLLFTEASAKTGQGIQEIFETIAKAIPVEAAPTAGGAGGAGAAGQRGDGQGGRARAREGVDLGEQQAKKVPTSKVSATTKKAKAPAASAGGVTNLGPSFDPFNQGDPFSGSGKGSASIDASVGSKADKIHIRLQQRNGRKTLTTVQGLPEKYDPKKLLKAMKKEFACNGTVVASADSDDEDAEGDGAGAEDDKKAAAKEGTAKPNFGQILQFQGDQRVAVKEFLVKAGLYSEKEAKDKIVIHGY